MSHKIYPFFLLLLLALLLTTSCGKKTEPATPPSELETLITPNTARIIVGGHTAVIESSRSTDCTIETDDNGIDIFSAVIENDRACLKFFVEFSGSGQYHIKGDMVGDETVPEGWFPSPLADDDYGQVMALFIQEEADDELYMSKTHASGNNTDCLFELDVQEVEGNLTAEVANLSCQHIYNGEVSFQMISAFTCATVIDLR